MVMPLTTATRVTSDSPTVECPVCGGGFPEFTRVARPGSTRVHVLCPNCGARERNRYLWLYLRNKTNLLIHALRVLHFAPERMLAAKLASQHNLQYISADLRRTRAMVHADITEIPFAEGTFDVILCSHVLEHVLDDRKAIRELYRVLRPGGSAVVMVPISSRLSQTFEDPTIVAPHDRERVFGQADHVRIYASDFRTRLQEGGFAVKVEDYRHELDEASAQRYGLRRRTHGLHLCVKNVKEC